MTEAFPWDTAPRYLLRDRDKSYGPTFRYRVRAMGITEVITAPRSPWQNPYAERLIGSIRRECLDHVIILNERHLRRVLSSYFQYHHMPERISRSTRTAHGLVACNFPPQAI
jgi:putative transposase